MLLDVTDQHFQLVALCLLDDLSDLGSLEAAAKSVFCRLLAVDTWSAALEHQLGPQGLWGQLVYLECVANYENGRSGATNFEGFRVLYRLPPDPHFVAELQPLADAEFRLAALRRVRRTPYSLSWVCFDPSMPENHTTNGVAVGEASVGCFSRRSAWWFFERAPGGICASSCAFSENSQISAEEAYTRRQVGVPALSTQMRRQVDAAVVALVHGHLRNTPQGSTTTRSVMLCRYSLDLQGAAHTRSCLCYRVDGASVWSFDTVMNRILDPSSWQFAGRLFRMPPDVVVCRPHSK